MMEIERERKYENKNTKEKMTVLIRYPNTEKLIYDNCTIHFNGHKQNNIGVVGHSKNVLKRITENLAKADYLPLGKWNIKT